MPTDYNKMDERELQILYPTIERTEEPVFL